jgi:hypothetical protein
MDKSILAQFISVSFLKKNKNSAKDETVTIPVF